MPSVTRVVVIGADAAGMSAAHQALRGARARGRNVDVVVLERTRDTSYSACGIPYWIAGDVADSQRLLARSAEQHRQMGVDLRTGCTATSLDLRRRLVHFRDETGAAGQLAFDHLVLATGAPAVIPAWARDGDGLISGVRPVKNLDDGAAWLDLLVPAGKGSNSRPGPRRAVLVGGGYIGLEMAEALVRHGLHATLITRTRVMSSLDPDMSTRITATLDEAGIEVLTGTQVASLTRGPAGAAAGVVTTGGRTCPADLVVLGLGARPGSGLGAHAGLPLGRSGGYLPDPRGQIADGIWAAGDCCEAIHRITGDYVFAPLGTHANKQGRVVGENLTGGEASFGGILGTAITRFAAGDQYVEIARTGLSTGEAGAAGLPATGLVTEGRTASGYMPEASPIATKVLADRRNRRLLGVQVVGGRGAGKRIDTAAAALWGAMTVDDLAGMDLAYAPPFATVWEAVQLAARRLADRLGTARVGGT
jgi:NADPH-dependent 2,4-dienoyl-CoA reductase/sulfur reductase-like enzyme